MCSLDMTIWMNMQFNLHRCSAEWYGYWLKMFGRLPSVRDYLLKNTGQPFPRKRQSRLPFKINPVVSASLICYLMKNAVREALDRYKWTHHNPKILSQLSHISQMTSFWRVEKNEAIQRDQLRLNGRHFFNPRATFSCALPCINNPASAQWTILLLLSVFSLNLKLYRWKTPFFPLFSSLISMEAVSLYLLDWSVVWTARDGWNPALDGWNPALCGHCMIIALSLWVLSVKHQVVTREKLKSCRSMHLCSRPYKKMVKSIGPVMVSEPYTICGFQLNVYG